MYEEMMVWCMQEKERGTNKQQNGLLSRNELKLTAIVFEALSFGFSAEEFHVATIAAVVGVGVRAFTARYGDMASSSGRPRGLASADGNVSTVPVPTVANLEHNVTSSGLKGLASFNRYSPRGPGP